MSSSAGLVATGLSVTFGGMHAVQQIDLRLEPAEVLGLIGPNGAGKTTLTNALTGFQRYAGSVTVDGSVVTGWSAPRLARLGVRRSFQAVRLFEGMSARENLEVTGLGLGLGRRQAAHEADRILRWCGLTSRADRPATSLPYGQERLLGLARALVGPVRYVLLDEPAAGMNEEESDELLDLLREVPDRFGCGLLVIEHDMRLIMRLCQRIHVINYGRTLTVGTPAQVRADPAVVQAYLGTGVGAVDA